MTSLPDAADRERALDTTRSFHVEAPAGSGKTALLTARFLKLLGQVQHPGQILALTFTNRAAGEMAERCFDVLIRARDGGAPENDWDQRLLELGRAVWDRHGDKRAELGSPDGLRIMTFHGFCHLLARAAPLESGAGLGAELLAEADQPLLSREAAAGFCQEILHRPPDDPWRQAVDRRLLRLDNRLGRLVDELCGLIQRRDLLADLLSEPPDDLGPDLTRRLQTLAEARLTALRLEFGRSDLGRQWPALVDHLRDIDAPAAEVLPHNLPGDRWDDLPDWQALDRILLTRTGRTPRRQFGPNSEFSGEFDRPAWAGLISGLPRAASELLGRVRDLPTTDQAPALMAEVVAHLGDLLQLAGGAVETFGRHLRAKAALDYVALEEAALNLFGEDAPTDLQLYLDHRLQHLLVDEFQDTSRRQWDLIRRMCLGWEPGDGRTVFVVGDPKQSIFRFRKAEVGLFVQAGRDGLPLPHHGRLALEPLRLRTNFRSSPRLIEWVNDLFDRTVMTAVDPEADEVEFQPGRAAPGAIDTGAQIAASVFYDAPESSSPLLAEARWLGGQVAALLNRPRPPESIAVLLRARTNLTVYLAALKDYGVPVRLKEGLRLMDAPEAGHLVNLARALCRPHDDLAWAGLLRAPWSWFEIADLVKVRDALPAEGRSWRQRIEAAAEHDARLARVWAVLAEGAGQVGRRPLAEVVEAVWLDLGGARGAARLSGPAGVENCRAVLALLAAVEGDGPHRTLDALERRLDGVYQPEDPAAADSPVQMMTVHGAKGLEFDAVFVPDLGRDVLGGGRGGGPPYLSVRLPGSGEHLLAVAPDRRTKNSDPLYQLLWGIERSRDLAEAKRLFYVALTRARRELYLSGPVKSDRNGGLAAPNAKSWLAWLLDHEGLIKAEVTGGPHQTLTGRSGIQIVLNPARSGSRPVGKKVQAGPPVRPRSIRVTAQRPGWDLVAPSGLVEADESRASDDDQAGRTGPPDRRDAWRGTVIHRLFQGVAEGRARPDRAAVARALVQEGLAADQAAAAADRILAEVEACLADKFLADLLQGETWTRHTEWALEAAVESEAGRTTILSGELDLVAHDTRRWIILDYKTGRVPAGVDPAEYARDRAAHYAPQLCAYRLMLARQAGLDESRIEAGIYLTPIQEWQPLEPD
ncbi:MAG: UvrD-helicase domain-containing protein [Proteobacteria bacterium]|nr:UvrD-helicase domain-containing protein [Pseudomonadota bacterium]